MLNSHPLKVHGYTLIMIGREHHHVKCDEFDKIVYAIRNNRRFVELVGLADEEIILCIADITSVVRMTPKAMNLINKANESCMEMDEDEDE